MAQATPKSPLEANSKCRSFQPPLATPTLAAMDHIQDPLGKITVYTSGLRILKGIGHPETSHLKKESASQPYFPQITLTTFWVCSGEINNLVLQRRGWKPTGTKQVAL